jgi:allantoinase
VLVVRGRRIVLDGTDRPAALHIVDGRIAAVRDIDNLPASDRPGEVIEVVDAGDLVVSPGIVDSHVHINEPGRTEWEGFHTATRAAAAGGVTTIIDMPLNSVPATTDVAALEQKRRAARGQCHVDVGFWGGAVPGNIPSGASGDCNVLESLVDAGVRGFKCFLVPSGVDEFQPVDEPHLRRALPVLAGRNVVLLVHAELPDRITLDTGQPASYRDYMATRPAAAEVDAIRLVAHLAGETGARVHIVHVSSAGGVDAVDEGRSAGVRITAETCPHYLTFSASDVPDGATEYKCAPPIRDLDHREALWRGLASGTLGMVASDHSPAPPALKCRGDFVRAWGGIASIELGLPAVWTEARARGFGVADIARWMSEAPAALAGLSERKGRIALGYDADLVVWDPDQEFTVDVSQLQQRHKVTPYAGRQLRGAVRTTFVRGQRVWDRGGLVQPALGELL